MPDDVPMITMFMEKNVDDMSRDEAVAALKVMGRLYDRALKDQARTARATAIGQCELWRRGEHA